MKRFLNVYTGAAVWKNVMEGKTWFHVVQEVFLTFVTVPLGIGRCIKDILLLLRI